MKSVVSRLKRSGVSVWADAAGGLRPDSGTRPGGRERLGGQERPSGQGLGPLVAEAGLAGVRMGAYGTWTLRQVREMCDQLAPVHRHSGGADGLVSVPVRTGPGARAGTLANRARALRAEVGRPNLVVRLPALPSLLPALTACLADGIAVEAAEVCSPRESLAVAHAFLDGLEQARAAGRDLSGLASVVAYGVTAAEHRADTRLDFDGSDEAKALRGRAGLAGARLAHRAHRTAFGSARWEALSAAGAPRPRLLWVTAAASAARSAHFAEELVTEETISAVPEDALRLLAERGVTGAERVRRHYADADRARTYLAWFGVHLEDVRQPVPPPPAPRAVETVRGAVAPLGLVRA